MLAQVLGYEKEVFIIDGRTKDRLVIETAARESDDCVVILQSASSEGLDLASFDTMIFASLSYSLLNHTQSKARLENIENLTLNTYYYLTSTGADSHIHKRIMKGLDFQETLYTNDI